MLLLDEKKLAALLNEVKVIAVIGAVDKPGRPVDMVGRYLIEAGFKVIPVHPKRQDVWGLKTYKSILDIPEHIDLVDVFRAPGFCPDHAEECLKLNTIPKVFWMQQGIYSPESREILSVKKITVIEDRCIMVDHKRLVGKKL
ncbi:CoA-binding protein [Maridesulfovibrio ferrireducens]|uniref:CoA-binding protein n=1 Tax=Maridesulfovibrio ferrireducens TaxID=246191 RepID=UPI001A29EFA4|nr:CoA-binding protein [Maridesulfovibrio ferrireducens]MBI9110574.1 CoA-binding protein [Maridesulfovibrio ferrireducens]